MSECLHENVGDYCYDCGENDLSLIELTRLRAENERLKALASRCLLNEPPGDCYAAEVVELRAENEAMRADAERLDSGVIQLQGRDTLGNSTATLHIGVNLRAAIDAARAALKETTP